MRNLVCQQLSGPINFFVRFKYFVRLTIFSDIHLCECVFEYAPHNLQANKQLINWTEQLVIVYQTNRRLALKAIFASHWIMVFTVRRCRANRIKEVGGIIKLSSRTFSFMFRCSSYKNTWWWVAKKKLREKSTRKINKITYAKWLKQRA